MEKKRYSTPLAEVKPFCTQLMSITNSASSVLPGPGSQAPKRKTEVF